MLRTMTGSHEALDGLLENLIHWVLERVSVEREAGCNSLVQILKNAAVEHA